jgi:hypothetical protein
MTDALANFFGAEFSRHEVTSMRCSVGGGKPRLVGQQ